MPRGAWTQTIASDRPLHALDTMTEKLDYAMSVVRHLESVATTPELRAAFNAVQPKVSAFYSSLPLNEGLWKAIQRTRPPAKRNRSPERCSRYLTKTIDSFKRHGAELDPAGKARLKEIDVALSEVTTKFSENVLDSTNAWELVLTDEEQLAGLPPSAVAAARASAESKGRRGLALHAAGSQLYGGDDLSRRRCDSRAGLARLQLARPRRARTTIARCSRGFWNCGKEKARLLGFRDFADLVLDDRMAHTGARAQKFLEDLRAENRAALPRGESGAGGVRRAASCEPWDIGYWAEKQRAALYDFDEEALRPYFPLERVVDGNVRDLRPRASASA